MTCEPKHLEKYHHIPLPISITKVSTVNFLLMHPHSASLVEQETRQQCGELSHVHPHLLDDISKHLKTYHDVEKDGQVSSVKYERLA
jgi:hypothetical protein